MSALRHVPPAHSPVPPSALAAGLGALASGDGGPRERMAARLERRFGARRVLFTDSGTSALRLALEGTAASGGGTAPRVALPAYGCYDLLTAARGAGPEALLYDLDPATLSPDPASLRRALDAGAGVVVAAHLYGVPVDLDAVRNLARAAGALVVDDAAQGVGAAWRGRPLGAFGSLSVLSFGRGKGRSGGGGGALLAHDPEGVAAMEAVAHRLPAVGRGAKELLVASAQWALARPALYALPASLPFLGLGETVYRPPAPARRIAPTCLAVLEGSWDPSLREAAGRRRRAGRLLPRVGEAEDLSAVRPPEHGRPGYLRLPVLAERPAARRRLSSPRARRLGVMPGYPRPLHHLEAFGDAAGDRPGDAGTTPDRPFPGAESLARRLFTLPVHGRMSAADLGRVERLIATPGA